MTVAAAMLVSLVLALAACGGGDENASEATVAAEGGGGGATVTAELGTADDEYALVLTPAEAPAGSVTFATTNGGALEHELIVIATDKGAANLGTDSGAADEAGVIDELELEPGASGDLTLDLATGPYAIICNIEDHYAQGMYADFTVK